MSNNKAIVPVSIAIAVVAIAAVVLGIALSGGSEETFETPTYPFSFDYPSDWTATRNATFTAGAGAGERTIAVQYKPPFDQVSVTQYKLRRSLPAGVPANQREVDRVIRRLSRKVDGNASEARSVTYGEIPGYQYVIDYETDAGQQLRNTITYLFEGDNQYQIICQSTPENRDTLEEGCDQVLSTIKFEG